MLIYQNAGGLYIICSLGRVARLHNTELVSSGFRIRVFLFLSFFSFQKGHMYVESMCIYRELLTRRPLTHRRLYPCIVFSVHYVVHLFTDQISRSFTLF